MIIICEKCGKERKLPPSKIKNGRKYCSKKCYFESKIGRVSPMKGRKIGKHKSHILSEKGRETLIASNKRRVWTDEMREKLSKCIKPAWIFLRGENNPNWKKDKSKSERLVMLRKTVAYEEWRNSVFERDKYTCQECGDKRGGNLEADHIKPFAYFPELRFELSNGKTLCKECHKKTPTWGHKVHKYAINNK